MRLNGGLQGFSRRVPADHIMGLAQAIERPWRQDDRSEIVGGKPIVSRRDALPILEPCEYPLDNVWAPVCDGLSGQTMARAALPGITALMRLAWRQSRSRSGS
jgi:hypothetical protein